jgi:DNA-binding XRE family transcriptional regulator
MDSMTYSMCEVGRRDGGRVLRKADARFDAHLTRLRGKRIAMSVAIRAKIKRLNVAQRRKIKERAAELIAEEMSLRDLRRARKLTQARLAKTLGITQDSVSRLEKRSDLLLSTLQKTVRAMGGDVRIVAQFPDRPPVVLSRHLQDLSPRKSSRRPARARRQ